MAISWESKDPGETDTRRHDFSGLLDTGETVTAYAEVRLSGSATIVSPTFPVVPDGGFVDYLLTGGQDGETSVFAVTITTDVRGPLDEFILLPVASRLAKAIVLTGYAVPTPGNLRTRFLGKYDAVADSSLAIAITRAGRQVGTNWTEGDYAEGIMLFAAGLLTVEGLGVISQGDAAVLGGLKTMQSGALKVEFKDAAQTTGATTDPFALTSYGKLFASLRRQNVGGARVTNTGAAPRPAIYGGLIGYPWGSC